MVIQLWNNHAWATRVCVRERRRCQRFQFAEVLTAARVQQPTRRVPNAAGAALTRADFAVLLGQILCVSGLLVRGVDRDFLAWHHVLLCSHRRGLARHSQNFGASTGAGEQMCHQRPFKKPTFLYGLPTFLWGHPHGPYLASRLKCQHVPNF